MGAHTGYVRDVDVERLRLECDARRREILSGLHARMMQRVAAGDDPRIMAAEEVHRAVAQLDAAEAAEVKALDAAMIYFDEPQ